VCHRDNVEKVQIIIALLFLVLQAQYPKLNVDGPFYPKTVTALKSTYKLGDDSVYTNSVTRMRLDPKTHPIYHARSKAHVSLCIKGCTMFDRQAQDPSDVTVTSSQALMIHTQEGDKDSSKEEDDEEEHDMDVDSTATKTSDDQATFRSLGMGKQSSAGSTDAEAAMGQMTLDNVPRTMFGTLPTDLAFSFEMNSQSFSQPGRQTSF
jgi:FlaG/FlaF family flagellin (archaellin)